MNYYGNVSKVIFLTTKNICIVMNPGGGHSISKLPYVRPKIWLSKLNPYSAVQNGEFHTLRVHFNNEKQPLQLSLIHI